MEFETGRRAREYFHGLTVLPGAWTVIRVDGRPVRASHRAGAAGTTVADKNQLLFEHGININDVPAWRRRGAGLWWEAYPKTGFDPVRGADVTTTRRRITVDRDLPLHDDYRALVNRLAAPALP